MTPEQILANRRAGGKKAALKNRANHGADFYKRIGAKGGKKGRTGGFYGNREAASRAGHLGGIAAARKHYTADPEQTA